MTPSLGPALSGFAAARTTADHPGASGKKDDAGFGKMVHTGAGAHPEKQPAAEGGSRDPRWSKLATELAAQAGADKPVPADEAKTLSKGLPVAKSSKDGKDAGADKEAETSAADSDTSPLQDQLPLLTVLHELRNFSTSANSADAGDAGQKPALEGQVLPKAYQAKSAAGQDHLEPMSKPERVSLTDGSLTKLDGQAARNAAAGAPQRDNAIAAGPLPETAPADVPGVDPKQAAQQPKSIADVQSTLRSEPGKQQSVAARIDVVSERSFPAPPQAPISQAALNVIGAISADGGPSHAFSTPSSTAQLGGPVAVPTHVLKIELHPAELGMVTANLRLSGEQLSIELKPETHDAYRRLSSDSEAIVKSLRGLGFDVDKVSIMQPSVAVPATTRADGTASMTATPGRDQSSFQPGNSGGGSGGTGSQQSGQQPARGSHDDAQDYGRAASPSRERAGGGMFI